MTTSAQMSMPRTRFCFTSQNVSRSVGRFLNGCRREKSRSGRPRASCTSFQKMKLGTGSTQSGYSRSRHAGGLRVTWQICTARSSLHRTDLLSTE